MSAGFTPGPWMMTVKRLSDNSLCVAHVVTAAERICVAQLALHGDDETIANARMLAAAPELYRSLIELLEPLERASAELVGLGKAADENAEAAFDRARAALAKARGEQVPA